MIENTMDKAFTLVESAIVIVIIGALIAGIFIGQTLAEQAKISKTIKQVEEYKGYRALYFDKYKSYPGDNKNAFAFFGSKCAITSAECDGDGDGKVNTLQESYMFWKHLALSGIYPNGLTGKAPVGGGGYNANENTPAGPYDGSALVVPGDPLTSKVHYQTNTDFNFIELGRKRAGCFLNDGNYRCGIVAADESYKIEQKLDDGDPYSGKVLVLRGREFDTDPTACVTGPYNSTSPVEFILSDSRKSCRIIFIYE